VRWIAGLVLALALMAACGDDGAEEGGGVAAATSETSTTTVPTADDIPVAHTPPGGYGDQVPEPVLAGCTEPLVEGAPDLRGLWRAVEVSVGGAPVTSHPAVGHVERVEQCGDRLVVTGGGVVHDMRVDGTEENGVDDVAQADFTTPITVVATYEDGVHVLRPVGLDVEVTRRIEGDQMVWDYVAFTARLDRIGGPNDPFPSEEDSDG
jgi:hypothetical protein